MRRKIFVVAFLSFVAITHVLYAQVPGIGGQKKTKKSDLNAPIPVDKTIRLVKMENGLTYYLKENKKPEGRIQFRFSTRIGTLFGTHGIQWNRTLSAQYHGFRIAKSRCFFW